MWNKTGLVSFKALSRNSFPGTEEDCEILARFVGDPSTPRMQVKLNIDVAVNDINPSGWTKRTIGKPKSRLQLNFCTSEWDSSVVIVTWLRDKQPRKSGSILCRGQEIFYPIEIEAHPFCVPDVGGPGREAYYLVQ